MKIFKTILTLVLVAALAMVTVACLDDGKMSSDDGTNGTPAPATFGGSDGDRDATAVTLGDLVFTAGEVEDMYNQYVSYMGQYGMAAPATDEEIASTLDIAIQEIVSSNALVWQANLQGVVLSEEEIAEVDSTVDNHEQELINAYKDDITASSEETMTAEELEVAALEAIETDVAANFGEGYTLADYLEEYRDYCLDEALAVKMEKLFVDAYVADTAAVTDWFNTTLEKQRTDFTADPLSYRTVADAYAADPTSVPALITPDGFVRVQIIEIKPEGTLEDSYNTNKTQMAELEAEYGKLVLTGENTARQREIEAEYLTLKNAVDATYALYIKDARAAAEAAYAKLQAGEDFLTVLNEYGTAAPNDLMNNNGVLLYTLATDSNFASEVWSAAAAMPIGTTGSIIEIEGAFYIVKVLAAEPAGEMNFSDNKDVLVAAAQAELSATAWTEQITAWSDEAMAQKVTYPEAYAYIGH